MEKLNQYCPVIHSVGLDEGVKRGVSAEYDTYNVPVELTDKERGVYNM
jgi:superfamily II DNA or RNA helicase